MTTVLPNRSATSSTGTTSSAVSRNARPASSFASSTPSRSWTDATANDSKRSAKQHRSNPSSSSAQSARLSAPSVKPVPRRKPIRSQYPPNDDEQHVEYILVASFDIDRGSIMEHQYPSPVGGDEHMLAELMLPDQTHLRAQDWTIFFLHKDPIPGEYAEEPRKKRKKRRKDEMNGEVQANGGAEIDENGGRKGDEEEESTDEEDNPADGPPLVYVLNLVNTKQDNTVKRGAIVKAMAICTRHSFLHIYKPLLLLGLEQYFANPVVETLASLYDALNSMDLSLLPRLTSMERFLLQSSEAKDMFIEKFEAMIAQRIASSPNESTTHLAPSPSAQARGRYGLPRDTHEFESMVKYANVPVPIKVPTALSPETVGDFSLIKLITTFSTPHATAPLPVTPTHPHLTTAGSHTHPIIVLLNALLTQKRVIFLGHNLPSSDVAEAVLGACALASGGMLRGFTRHAFPYTDLTKIDELLKVPGFIAGVTNPAFANKSEWWDLLCDLPTGRMRISPRIEQATLTEGVAFFQQPANASTGAAGSSLGGSTVSAAGASLSAGLGGNASVTGVMNGDPTGDAAFMANVLAAINERHGENAIRSKFRRWILRFTRLAAAFEETVYGASTLQRHTVSKAAFDTTSTGATIINGSDSNLPQKPSVTDPDLLPPEVTGHGYVWPSPQHKTLELAANATRIEGWRNTRSYYNFIQDLASASSHHRPIHHLDLQHLHDKLAKLRLPPTQAANIYLALCAAAYTDSEILQLLCVVATGTWDVRSTGAAASASSSQGQGLFYIALGLFHPRLEVREQVAALLGRVREHEAGRHFWNGLGRFARMACERVSAVREARERVEAEEGRREAGWL